MNWTELLKSEMETTYGTTMRLLDKVDPENLHWKPASGSNWMTLGQLLKHISNACGSGCKGFVLGDWGLPPGKTFADLSPEENLPPAEKLPDIASVAEAKKLLHEDHVLALQMVEKAGEHTLANRSLAAPWASGPLLPLGQHLLRMIQHLDKHKSQLFYYLKLLGKPVNTIDLWG